MENHMLILSLQLTKPSRYQRFDLGTLNFFFSFDMLRVAWFPTITNLYALELTTSAVLGLESFLSVFLLLVACISGCQSYLASWVRSRLKEEDIFESPPVLIAHLNGLAKFFITYQRYSSFRLVKKKCSNKHEELQKISIRCNCKHMASVGNFLC